MINNLATNEKPPSLRKNSHRAWEGGSVNRLSSQEINSLVSEHGTPLFVIDLREIEQNYIKFRTYLPGVEAFYAMKSLTHREVISCLNRLGCKFDVASCGEFKVLESANVDPTKTIYSHPYRKYEDIEYALAYGCQYFVCDSVYELDKFIPIASKVKIFLRLSFENQDALVNLSKKFGSLPSEIDELIYQAHKRNLDVVGLSFHVGSQMLNSQHYIDAIQFCYDTSIRSKQKNLYTFKTLNIGGGFPVSYGNLNDDDEKSFFSHIREELIKIESLGMNVIAEPGRFISASSAISISQVVGKSKRQGVFRYYIDDGVYGSFSGQIYDGAIYPLHTSDKQANESELHSSTLFGITCDSVDVIREGAVLPELGQGDLIIGTMMGAYTVASSSDFNGFSRPNIVIVE